MSEAQDNFGGLSRGDIMLSDNFSLFELTNTKAIALQEANRKVNNTQIERLTALCQTILQPIRNNFRLPMKITSGYRGPELNKKIGGSATSQHLLCEAADFVIPGLDDMEGSLHIFEWIYQKSDIPFGQLIHEHVKRGQRDVIWIHISLGEPYRNRGSSRQVYKYRKRAYVPILNPRQRAI